MPSTSTPRKVPETSASARDLATVAALHASLGGQVLKNVLQMHFARADELCEELQAARRRSEWHKAGGLALQLAAKTAGLGFHAVTNAARSFALATQDDVDAHTLRNGAQLVVFEHERLRLAIIIEYPELLV
jgi:hypothetical protein